MRRPHHRWQLTLLVQAALGSAALAAGPAPQAPDNAAGSPEYIHVAQPGDTLIGVGRRFLADPRQWPQLQRLNRVGEPRRLPIGQALRIPLRLMRVESAPMAVQAASGGVRSAGKPVAAGQTLPAGNDLATDRDGSVTVRLVDGTLLRLRSEGRVWLQESQRLPMVDGARAGVRLEQGRVEVQAQRARGGQPGFRILTPQGVLAVRGTEFRVSVDGQRTTGEVLSGVVAAVGRADGAATVPVAAGQGVVVDGNGRAGVALPLLPPPSLAGLPARHERPLVRLHLAPQPQAQAWRVQVARDADFDELLADVRSTTPELRIAGLPDGRFPMRVRAIAANGLEGRDALAVLTLKARPEPPLLLAPTAQALLRGGGAELRWTASSEAASYRLQLARDTQAADPFAAPLQDVRDLQATSYAVADLPPGRYLWRVGSVRADGDAGPFGDVQGFELRALPPQPAPLPPPQTDASGVRLTWAGQTGQQYELQVARDEAFTVLLTEQKLAQRGFELSVPPPGRYYVRLRVRDADGVAGPWSALQFFDIVGCVRDSASTCVRTEGGVLRSP